MQQTEANPNLINVPVPNDTINTLKMRRSVKISFAVSCLIFLVGIIFSIVSDPTCDKHSVAGLNLSNFPVILFLQTAILSVNMILFVNKTNLIIFLCTDFVISIINTSFLFVFFIRNAECLSGNYSHTAGFLMYMFISYIIKIVFMPLMCAVYVIDLAMVGPNAEQDGLHSDHPLPNQIPMNLNSVVIQGYNTNTNPPSQDASDSFVITPNSNTAPPMYE